MWFSNLICYRFKQETTYIQDEFEKALEQDIFRACTSQELSSFGWTKPLGKHGQSLSHFSQNAILVCAKREEKVLPASVINELLAEKIEHIEAEENRPVKKKEKDELKENLLHSLLPQAFKKSSLQYAFIDLEKGWLIVNSGSFNKAEELLALLRKSLGTLPVVPAFVNYDLGVFLTSWLTEFNAPEGFAIGQEAELVDPTENGGQVKLKQHDLASDEVKNHLTNGKVVTKLAFDWQERVKFILQEDGSIKRLSYSETLKEENADIPKDDMAVKLDADFILASEEIKQLLEELIASLGEPENPIG
ncbi:recombination-associated protein RdgC [Pseudoalteromonas tunicata]|uniref:Recombination-associated protein RdgC n=1 Tax=Pseudoalteromonas tunicata D2 TaxID=87626 RepID=A4C6Q4_9GAMM|nr:recombination-associated protein RdgC [Pseudoalteromonas tunicata]ATC95632.1 recombination associated protein RdgC [Pseudoalteromonas tunicata]AXT31200.1 recombination-associated protein RdgC [Pseudoalteromonas tunicata]EAR29658.1 nucleoid-associated protein [Pseudoalteromonas tunicata D2]MDP4984994.1 recombination-associated protein RdgC [Pseudoalteromonas tunicata]MDP5212555.1 recombination-associated protein RdgC [Pseudoalteromonas tunicata]